MSYTPRFAILTPRAIPDNLLAYVTDSDRLTDALTWAGDGGLKAIKTFSKSVANRGIPAYPSIAFTTDEDAQTFGNDLINAGYSCTFEVLVVNSDPDTAVEQARVYDAAIRSLIVNCPVATLKVGSGVSEVIIDSIETGFDIIKTNTKQTEFLQQFQIRVVYQLEGSIFI